MTTKTIAKTKAAQNKKAKKGLFFYIARRNNLIASFAAAKETNKAPELYQDFLVETCSENIKDVNVFMMTRICQTIEKQIATHGADYCQIYTTRNVALKFREVIAHRENDEDTMLASIKKEWMTQEQLAMTEIFAKTIRKATAANFGVSVRDFRELNYLEFRSLNDKQVRAGMKIAFEKGKNPNFETYGFNVTGTFPVVNSTREGEEDKLLIDIRQYGSANNPNSFMAFSRKVLARLNEELNKDNGWDALLTGSKAAATDTSAEVDEDPFGEVIPF